MREKCWRCDHHPQLRNQVQSKWRPWHPILRVYSLVLTCYIYAFFRPCYGLNVSIPPNPYVEILTVKDDGMRRWGLWEVLMSWVWSPQGWDQCLVRMHQPWNRKTALTRRRPNQSETFILDFQAFTTVRNNFCCLQDT